MSCLAPDRHPSSRPRSGSLAGMAFLLLGVTAAAGVGFSTPRSVSAAPAAETVDTLIDFNGMAGRQFDRVQYHVVAYKAEGGGDQKFTKVVAADVKIDGDKVRIDEESNAASSFDPSRRASHLVANGEYLVAWPDHQEAAYQYMSGGVEDGKPTYPHNGAAELESRSSLLVVNSVFGNSITDFATYRKSLGDKFVWTARSLGRDAQYVLRLQSPGTNAVEYTIDPAKMYAVVGVRVTKDGKLAESEDYRLAEVAPGFWFPSRLDLTDYATDGSVKRRRRYDVTEVSRPKEFPDATFTVKGLGFKDDNRVFLTLADGSEMLAAAVDGAVVPQSVLNEMRGLPAGESAAEVADHYRAAVEGKRTPLLTVGTWVFAVVGGGTLLVLLAIKIFANHST